MNPNDNKNENPAHILNTSATLLGLCFIVLTSIKIENKSALTFIDELTAIAISMFMASCVMSFITMRSKKELRKLEFIADITFFVGLFFLFVTTILVTFNIIK